MKFKLLLLCTLLWLTGTAQNLINVTSFTMPKPVPAKTADWGTLPSLIVVATNTAQGGTAARVQESKVAFTIKSNGNKVCGGNLVPAGFTAKTRVYKASEISGMLNGCILKPGSYQLCVQFFADTNGRNVPISAEKCATEFAIEGTTPTGNTTNEKYTAPQNISPADKKTLNEREAKTPLTFRWTPLVPRPQSPVTYKLRVWQLMQGQNGTAAMKANTLVVEKEVKGQTQFIKQNLMGDVEMIDGAANLVWNVQAVNEQGAVLGSSTPTSFKIIITDPSDGCFSLDTTQYKIECNGFDNQGKQNYKLTNLILKNTGTNPGRTGLITTGASPYIIPVGFSVSSPLPTSATGILPGNSIPISFNINGATGSAITFYIYATIPDPAGDVNVACDKRFKVQIDLPSCKCDLCDAPNSTWEIQSQLYYDSTSTNNILTLHNDISFGPHKIVKLSAEVVDFYWYTEGDCKKCTSNDYYWGNLISGSIKGSSFTQGVSAADADGIPLPTSHQLDFLSINPAGANISSDVYLNLSLPQQTLLSCCTDCFRFCVRYTVTFMQNGVCKTCSIVKCYETKRKHRKILLSLATNQCGEKLYNPGDFQDASTPVLDKKNN